MCAHARAPMCTCTRAPIRTGMHAHMCVHTRHEGMPPAGPALCRFGTRVPGTRRGLHGLLAVCRQREHQPGPLDSWPLPRTRPEALAVRGSDPFRCLRVPLVSSRASASPPGGRRSSRGAVPDFDGQSRATLAGPSLHLADSREAAAGMPDARLSVFLRIPLLARSIFVWKIAHRFSLFKRNLIS